MRISLHQENYFFSPLKEECALLDRDFQSLAGFILEVITGARCEIGVLCLI